MASKTQQLFVLMNGLLVGCLEKSPRIGLSFTYDKGWLERKNARPISLSLPLVESRFNCHAPTLFLRGTARDASF